MNFLHDEKSQEQKQEETNTECTNDIYPARLLHTAVDPAW